MAKSRPKVNRRKRKKPRRIVPTRRRSDFYWSLGKFCGLIATICVAILGQAELIGEPWRHYITIAAIVSTAVWAYGMHPASLMALGKMYKQMRAGKMLV